MDIVAALLKFIPKERIRARLIDRVSYASDAGFYSLIPEAVVLPETVEDVKQLFAFAQRTKIPLTFRAGGTSLSGQSISDGILVELSQFWRSVEPQQDGQWVKVQPGAIGAMVNLYLKKYKTKIGPDPASINSAMMGGILSNNSSGMCCGVEYNSYHTLRSIKFILPNGLEYNSADDLDYPRFVSENSRLASKITELRNRIIRNFDLRDKIREKYKTKNTLGYSLNAFLDYEHPLDILGHLLIGAEGTLGFIAEAVLNTIPDLPYKASAMLYFPSMYDACAAIVPLKESGAKALELMDRAALASIENMSGMPEIIRNLPANATALLCEYQTADLDLLHAYTTTAQKLVASFSLIEVPEFTTDPKKQMLYWKIRKGLFPTIGAVRAKGTTVVLEDIAFPVDQLADAVTDLQKLFVEFQYEEAIIFGHAKDGNIHFVITQDLGKQEEIDRYDHFITKMVELVVQKYNGALKAEHGTGRNMAPFVATEWGDVAYSIMKELKEAVDPFNILNPGVIINADAKAHLKDFKSLPEVEAEVDKCIECGFCEHRCPSRDLTMTPRRRIVVRREIARLKTAKRFRQANKLLDEYQYDGLDTCAVDGLCATDCPVEINTGDLVKRLRKEQHGAFSNGIANALARNFRFTEWSAKTGLKFAGGISKLLGEDFLEKSSLKLRKTFNTPVWISGVKAAPSFGFTSGEGAEVVYFSACVSRMMTNGDSKSLQDTFKSVAVKAGVKVYLPKEMSGHCCGQAFSSKGYKYAADTAFESTLAEMWKWSENGRIPVICDFTSCTYTLVQHFTRLPAAEQGKYKGLKIMDMLEYTYAYLLPKLHLTPLQREVVIHPVCAATKLHLNEQMEAIAKACATTVIVPKNAGCCGMAGDRGFLVPELTHSATAREVQEICAEHADAEGFYASGTTCEIALSHASGKHFEHLIYLLDEASINLVSL